MTHGVEQRITAAVRNTALEPGAASAAELFVERARDPDALARIVDPIFLGVARALAARPDTASYLANRPELIEALADAGPDPLAARADALERFQVYDHGKDLEAALDDLRILRRDETTAATCFLLAGLVSFDAFSEFLSLLAETITQHSLALARASAGTIPFSVIGVGKIGGREFTHHSDLDLLFLYGGGTDAIDTASRVGQRLVTYLSTMTGAGIAYAVDARLRPSGGQGMLVTSLDAFETYQREQAQTWEHVAMLRARPIAGDLAATDDVLARVRDGVRSGHAPPWGEIAEMRARVETERAAAADALSLKTGPGGTMDVDFLAGGGLLERGSVPMPEVPSVPAMLGAACGNAAAPCLEAYGLLRRAEASVRWIAGRAVEAIEPEQLDAAAELTEPGLAGAAFADQLREARTRVRAAYDRVIAAGSIAALSA